MFTNTKELAIPDGDVVKIECNGVIIWELPQSYKNWVVHSTESDGTTIYNGGKGYKDGYRIRSGGVETTSDEGRCTGFIPFKKGDVLRIYPSFSGVNSTNAINFSNSDFTNLGQYNDSGSMYGICTTDSSLWQAIRTNTDGVTVIDISNVSNGDDVAFVRITHNAKYIGTKDFIVTVNEEIK